LKKLSEHYTQQIENATHRCLSVGFRWWGAWGPGVVGGPMCGHKMFR